MKPQSRIPNAFGNSGSQRDALCSPIEYRLMEITEDLYPVYNTVKHWY
jgi:hypothetical protein